MVNKKNWTIFIELTSKDAIEKFTADNKVAVVFFGEKGSTFETFEKFSKTFDDVVFGHCFDSALASEFKVDGTNVVLFK